ncbi:M23 family metallopeptidase [Crassaminicella profunda]|uniref:M23 family metallopeptidase n=1 Tax=Crassaminicella profunda TaxID=1286698 RepID=UPI001CA75D05|nr:M23 family metallopeptidase [Crassaminicella profunda]QZY55643.1 peptidoglycan DD-metalloendopeptidase family protein [Crassaminicella profunda]
MKSEECSRNIRDRFSKYYSRFNQKGNGKIYIGLLMATLIIGITVFFYMNGVGYIVKIDGKEVGIVRNKEDLNKIVDALETSLKEKYNTDIVFDERIIFESTKARDEELSKPENLEKNLQKFLDFKVKAYSIKVDNKIIASLPKKEDTKKVLEAVKKVYVDEKKEYDKIYFVEKVKVDEIKVATNQLKTYEDAIKIISQGTEKEELYEVQEGENFWTIAEKNKLSVDDLMIANPSIDPEKLQIKQKISLVVAKPLLTVATVEKEKYEEDIPYESKFEETNRLYKGDKKIKAKGQVGKKEILAEVVRYNGTEISKKTLEEKVVKKPKTEIVLKGTKIPPPDKSTGAFNNPTRGVLTSRFGPRWGKTHRGVDIAAKTGTPVKAVTTGIVIFSGWKGNYGNCVIINNGNGIQTLYAHNNKLLVKKGEKVTKGQVISLVGSTGNTTGPHVHFEVKKNGVLVNPLKYVKY